MAEDIVDVLIIGSGASGAAVAWSLAETGMRIVCLEQGDWTNPAEYPSTRRDWEVQATGPWSINPNVRKRATDSPIDDSESPITVVNFNGVGGSTVLHSAHWPRFHPSDFRVRTLDGVADDWPIDYATLDPFFALNDRNIGVSGLAGDPAIPAHQPPLPPVPLGLMGETIGRGFNKLGWHWWPSDSALITRDYEGREACANLGPCSSGCAKGAKSSADITYWPAARRAGVELRTHCRVREILVDENDMATGVVYSSLLNLLLSNNISIEIINKIIPPAIFKESIETPIQLKKNLPPYAKIINTIKEIKDALIAILNLCSRDAPSVNNKNKGPIPAASIATNKTAKELKKVELILNIYFGGSDGTRTRDLSRDRRSL